MVIIPLKNGSIFKDLIIFLNYLFLISNMEPKKAELKLSKRTDAEHNGITFNLVEKDATLGGGESSNLADVTRMILDCAEKNKVDEIESIEVIEGKDRLSTDWGQGEYIKRIVNLYNKAQ